MNDDTIFYNGMFILFLVVGFACAFAYDFGYNRGYVSGQANMKTQYCESQNMVYANIDDVNYCKGDNQLFPISWVE